MTAFDRFDRFEREIPDLMDELAPTRRPDYFDEMLRATAAARQRPAWSSLERWLPMGEIARFVPRPAFPWRPIVLFVVLTLVLLAGVLAVGGSQRRLPAPFGLAGNGAIVFGTADGDLATVDPVSGVITKVLADPAEDYAPWVSRDGQRMLFARKGDGGAESLFIAEMHGTDVRQLVASASEISWYEWSPDDRHVAVVYPVDGLHQISVIDLATLAVRMLPLDLDVHELFWSANEDEFVFRASKTRADGVTHGFYRVRTDGTGLTAILPPSTSEDDYMDPNLSPDGNLLYYDRWVEPDEKGRIRVVDIDNGVDRALVYMESTDELNEVTPTLSPDGTKIAFQRFGMPGLDGYKIVVAPSTGGGPEMVLGPEHPAMTNGATVTFSPDATKLLATYHADGSTWLFDLATGIGAPVPWGTDTLSWQRVAP